jgi:hypothetical protein
MAVDAGVRLRYEDSMASALESIRAAEERLATARFGLQDMADPKRTRAGLYNAVVFGRMVTFALQNMRNEVAGFDEWYAAVQQQLKTDPLMNFLNNLRTQIEKTAEQHTGRYTRIGSLDMAGIQRLPKPPGAFEFFLDMSGETGWNVKLPDGSVEKYYIEPPSSWQIDVGFLLSNAPEEFRGTDARELVSQYLDRMESIIAEAKAACCD